MKKNGVRVKIKASTILEVVISMVIIVFVIGISLMILSNVMRLSLSGKKLKANALAQQELLHAANGNINDTTFEINDIRINKTVKQSNLGKDLFLVDIKTLDANKNEICEQKSIVRYENK